MFRSKGGMMVEIRSFDGDFGEVHQLIKASWTEEYRLKHNQPVMDYSSVEFLRWNLDRPNNDPDLLLAAYSGSKLVSFGATIPLNLRFNDQKLKSALVSFLTTHVEYQGKGIAKTLMTEGLKRGIDKEYDLGYLVSDAGHHAVNLVKNLSKDLGLKFINFYRFTFLAKPLDKDRVSQLANLPFHQRIFLPMVTAKFKKINTESTPFDLENDTATIYQMLRDSCPSDALCVDWSKDELSTNLKSNLSNTFYLKSADKKAFINYYNINMLSGKFSEVAHKNTIVDYVCFDNMSINEKRKFVRDFCSSEKHNGSCSIVIPTLPVFDLKPFYFNLFFPTGRYHSLAGLDVKNKLKEPVKTGYLLIR